MSKEFYEYISKKLIFYFEENDKNIVHGTRYCMVLDNQDFIQELEAVFKDYAFNNKITNNWAYTPNDYLEATYNTFSLKFDFNEVVIVFKTKDMTEDFLATLRNTKTTILIITESPIDSISKGTENLANKGLPFYKDNIISDIKKNIKSSMLSKSHKAILEYEIKRISENINFNTTSIIEYKNILSILNNKEITQEDFNSFRLFYDDELDNIADLDNKKLAIQIKENNKVFEQIDRVIKYGNIEKDLEKNFDTSLINKLLKLDEYNWFENFNYKYIKKSKALKEKTKDINLDILEICAYSKDFFNKNTDFIENKNFFIANESTTKAGKRKKNILIFNKEHKENLTLKLNFNKKIKEDDIQTNQQVIINNNNNLLINLSHKKEDCTFHRVKVLDKNIKNNNYELKICIINISEDYFCNLTTSYLIKYSSNKSKNYLCFISNYDDILINNNKNNYYINNADVIENNTYVCIPDTTICLKFSEASIINDLKVNINIKILIENILIPVCISADVKKVIELTPLQAFKLKNKNKFSFKKVLEENKFILGTQEYYTKNDFLNDLKLEEVFINSGCFSLEIDEDGQVNKHYNPIPKKVEDAYIKLISYYKNKNNIPSLSYCDDELINIMQEYINSIEIIFKDAVEPEQVLDFEVKNILKLGVIERLDNCKEICFTPLNPLVMYYQLNLQRESREDIGSLNNEFLKKLNATNLLPYIQNNDKVLYKSLDFSQVNSFEWIYFTPVDNKEYKSNKAFVSKLVFEKIREYISHFRVLFKDINNNQFRINLLNISNYKEILIGILKYFAKELIINQDINNSIDFYINIYLSETTNINNNYFINEFSVLSDFNKLKAFIEDSGVKFNNDYSIADIANILTKKIKCFVKNNKVKEFEYAHVTFYEINSKADIGRVKSENIKTGLLLDGLLSSTPSMYYGEQYKTCFGFKFASKNKFTKFVNLYNSLHQVSSTSNPYTINTSLSTEVQKLSIEDMNKIYESSNWVTFIDPKVDLNFFKSDNITDLLTIHYSDQYTSSSNYDAITVTKKSKQYKNIITEFFKNKNINVTDAHINKLIGMFNAINGDWLLKLNNSNGQFTREKISILSAIKVALAYYSHSNIIWVPLSLEEILRVSGAVGLSKSDSLLSAKNLNFEKGPTSDDIMLIGVEEIKDKLYIHVQPIEVKIGNTGTMLNKAKAQVKNTAKEFINLLEPSQNQNTKNTEQLIENIDASSQSNKLIKDSLEHKLIKNFIMQLVISSAEKLNLYNVCEENYFCKIIDTYREKLLNDNFIMSSYLKPYTKDGCIIAFNNAINISNYTNSNSLEIIEIPEQLAIKYLFKEIYNIKEDLIADRIFNSRLEDNYKYLI